jgi:hypothetical protein
MAPHLPPHFIWLYWIVNSMGPRLLPLKKTIEHIGLNVWAMGERIWADEITVILKSIRLDCDRFMIFNKMDILDTFGIYQSEN